MRTAFCCGITAIAGLVPTPVGTGPRYRPAALAPRVCSARAPLDAGGRFHLELFANRRVVLVPAELGLRGARLERGRVVSAGCRARAWTLDPTGVVRFLPGTTLGGLFAVWRRALGPSRLLSFRGAVSLFVDGTRHAGDPRRLRLRDGAEVVVEVGGLVPPHRSFRFPP